MLTSGIRAKLVAFVIVGLLATTYLGARYVGINPTGSGYGLSLSMPDAGGIFENGEVTYLGVPVGRIKELKVTEQGMEAKLHIDDGAPKIPADVEVNVANRSAIGEQYVNLSGGTVGGETLGEDDRLQGTDDSAPPPIENVLKAGRDFTGSVPEDSLRTVIDESYDAWQGSGLNLSRLLETSQDFVETANTNFLVTSGLIENSSTVLTTQEQSAASIKGFSRDLNSLATTLSDSDGDLRALIANSPAAAREIDKLFRQVGGPLGILMGNLVSTAQIFGTNANGVEDALIRVPEAMSVGWAVNGSKGIDLGLAQAYFDPKPCTTGYGGTSVRDGLESGTGKPFNTKAGCTTSSRESNVRGPKSVPKPAGSASARVSVADSMSDLLGGGR